jgi:hypothetical protein
MHLRQLHWKFCQTIYDACNLIPNSLSTSSREISVSSTVSCINAQMVERTPRPISSTQILQRQEDVKYKVRHFYGAWFCVPQQPFQMPF